MQILCIDLKFQKPEREILKKKEKEREREREREVVGVLGPHR